MFARLIFFWTCLIVIPNYFESSIFTRSILFKIFIYKNLNRDNSSACDAKYKYS
jgi:hypothetical protein